MREFLREAFRHNAWATRELLAFCRGLTPQQLGASTRGAYGDIVATLNHLVVADARYLPRTAVTRPAWSDEHEDEYPSASRSWMHEPARRRGCGSSTGPRSTTRTRCSSSTRAPTRRL